MTTNLTPDVRRQRSEKIAEFIRSGLDRPLSEDDPDVYYPDSDGEPLADSDFQYYPATGTVHALRRYYRNHPDVYVSGDMLVYYRMNDSSFSVAPDVFVVIGVADHWRRSYIVWREGGKAPDFVMEIASPRTYVKDITEKTEIYAALGVTEYWRFDPTEEFYTPPLEGERLSPSGHYEPIAIAEDASAILRGHSDVLGLDICVLPGLQLRLYDPAAGTWLRNLDEAEDALEEAEDALEEANRQNAEQAARIRELEAQLAPQAPDSSENP